jgi:hypothetical protein
MGLRIVGNLKGIEIPIESPTVDGEVLDLLESYERGCKHHEETPNDEAFFLIAQLYMRIHKEDPPSDEDLQAMIDGVRAGRVCRME